MKHFNLLYLTVILLIILSSCKSEEERLVENTFMEFIKEDLTRFRGTYVTVTATASDFKFESYKTLIKYSVSDSMYIIEAQAKEYYPKQLTLLENKIALENNEVEWYDLQRGKSMRPPTGANLAKLTEEFNKLVEQENDIAAQVRYFEESTPGRTYRGYYDKYTDMDRSQILAVEVSINYRIKGQKATMQLLYNGDLTKVLRILYMPI